MNCIALLTQKFISFEPFTSIIRGLEYYTLTYPGKFRRYKVGVFGVLIFYLMVETKKDKMSRSFRR